MLSNLEVQKKCILLRGDLFSVSVLEITNSNLDSLEKDLHEVTKQAPNFFKDTPIVLDVNKVSSINRTIKEIKSILILNKLILIGIRGANDNLKKESLSEGIATLNRSRNHEPTLATKQQTSIKTETIIHYAENKIIDKPVRSGQQCYARDGDLIILSSVSEGAEVLADGNIHLYGMLRGRALAGVKGNKSARIFLHQSEAELISIGGVFTTQESQLKISQATQIALDKEKLVFTPL